jgi:hypothetical protein
LGAWLLGFPSLVVSIAANRGAACEALASELLIAYLCHKDAMMGDWVRLALQALLNAAGQRQRLSAAGAELVDCQGVEPVLTPLSDGNRSL